MMHFGQKKGGLKEAGDNLCHTFGAVVIDSGAKNNFDRRSKNNAALLGKMSGNGDMGVERGVMSGNLLKRSHIDHSDNICSSQFNIGSLKANK